jgi:hypothetical protein
MRHVQHRTGPAGRPSGNSRTASPASEARPLSTTGTAVPGRLSRDLPRLSAWRGAGRASEWTGRGGTVRNHLQPRPLQMGDPQSRLAARLARRPLAALPAAARLAVRDHPVRPLCEGTPPPSRAAEPIGHAEKETAGLRVEPHSDQRERPPMRCRPPAGRAFQGQGAGTGRTAGQPRDAGERSRSALLRTHRWRMRSGTARAGWQPGARISSFPGGEDRG